MTVRDPVYIEFSGKQGSGKTRFSVLIRKLLEEQGYKTEHLSPNDDTDGDTIKVRLND